MQPDQGVQARSNMADHCKAIGIVLVVWGHTPGIPAPLRTLVYSFHMPLFFFISGYLLKPDKLEQRLWVQARTAAHTLLTPYVFFFAVSLAYWLATRHIGSRAGKFEDVSVQDAVLGLFSGLSSDLFVNGALWFFPCMFLAQMIYRMAWKQLPSAAMLALASGVIAIVLLATTLPWQVRLPWGLDIVWVALVFFSVGHLIRVHPAAARCLAVLQRGHRPWLALLVLVPVWLVCSGLQGPVDLALANFGPHVLLYFLAAFCGIAIVCALGSQMRTTTALQWLARNTLLIFPLHALFINFGSGLVKLAGGGNYGPMASLLFTAWALLCTVPAALLLKRYCAFMLGLPRLRGGMAA